LSSPQNFTANVSADGTTVTGSMNGGPFTLRKTSSLTLQQPERAASSRLPSGTTDTLTQDRLAPIVAEAIARWETGLGLEAETTLTGVKIEVVDLTGEMLGEACGNTIRIDRDAAGYGWFVDATPHDDLEFLADASGTLTARNGSAAKDRADLLTTVMHEMGHMLGFSDGVSDDLMDSLLPLGTRRTLVDAGVAV
jgi:hypothetical protein